MISSKSNFIHIFNDFICLYMYIVPGQGQKTPWGQTFDVNRKPRTTSTICSKFQTNLIEFWNYTLFFMFFHIYIAPGQGQTTLCGQNSDVNRKALSLWPFVASFKKISLKSNFIHILPVFIHVYSPGTGADNPWGQNFYINIYLMSLWSFAVSFFH